jgi:hypothetical protein
MQVDKTGDCWLWTGVLDRAGYARFRPDSGPGKIYAHRWAYEQEKGPIPEGLEVDHLCSVRNCVRIDHLEAVTKQENIRRRWASGSKWRVA